MTPAPWLREPLVHFLVAGALLFAFYAWKGEEADPASRSITVTQEDRARLALQWQRMMQRPPTDAELDSLTEGWLREEILYREALRLGLDRDDAIVRKRLANKMDFLATSIAENAMPGEGVLEKWLADHPQNFAADTAYSFDQRYFANREAAEEAALRQSDAVGESISLPRTLERAPADAVARQFGKAFLGRLKAMPVDAKDWAGPVPSGFGWHVVRLRERQPGKVPPLAEVRQQVENDWRNATMETRKAEAYRLLREAYSVTVEK